MKGSVWILARGVSTYDIYRYAQASSNTVTQTHCFSVVQQRMFTPRTRVSRASSLELHCVPLNRIYSTTWTPVTVKHLARRFLRSLQYLTQCSRATGCDVNLVSSNEILLLLRAKGVLVCLCIIYTCSCTF